MKNTLLSCSLFVAVSTIAQVTTLQQNSDQAQQLIRPDKAARALDPIYYVNPFIGTGGHGHTFPGPVVPFGGIQVGPDTRPDGWDGCGGYHYSDSVIYGFSHTHLSGVGVPDYADLLVVPQQGKCITNPGYKVKGGYGARFSHQNEKATAGLYTVKLDNGIGVRLTATAHSALHEYTFQQVKGKKYLVIDLGYRDRVLEANATVVGKDHVYGVRRSEAWATDQHFYFDFQTNIPFKKAKWETDKKSGKYVLILEFPATTQKVLLKVGISGTDEKGALLNRETEINHWDFDVVMTKAVAAWRKELTALTVSTADQELLTNFYTALYHAYVHPSLWSDVDGRFRTFDNRIEQSKTPNYSVFSLWDTYRGANPLYTILQPERTSHFIESFRLQYLQTGLLPMWTLSNNETNCMIGYHSASIIADAAMKGIPLNEQSSLLEAMIASSTYDHLGKKYYGKQGFISANLEAESVSKTLEYAYDDWCIAQFAKKIGNDSVAHVYAKRSANWLHLMHPESGFFQARKGGLWLPNFKPNEVNHHYTEANAWQYSMAMPQHISYLVQLKGEKHLETFLDSLFLSSSEMSGRVQSDITGLIGQYAHGNEPSHHMAYLYNYCGAASKSQAILDQIMRNYYHNAPDGLSGNEDCGQMSAWFVLSAMGFYPVAPGSPTYAIGRPMFDHVQVKAGKSPFVINALNNSPSNKYIQSIAWKGTAYTNLYITHEMIQEGGVLEMTMGPNPSPSFEEGAVDLQDKVVDEFVPVPYFIAKNTVFSDELSVGLDKLPFEQGIIYYSVNDSLNFKPYDLPIEGMQIAPIRINETATVYAKVVRTYRGQLIESPVVQNTFIKYVQDKTIALETAYANQYAGGGPNCLVDGMRGTDEYRGTEWQGFYEKDIVATITLNEPKEISSVTVSALQDMRSWIFAPKGLVVSYSLDGITYKSLGMIHVKPESEQQGVQLRELKLECIPMTVKYLKITVENAGKCPEWHLGAGNPTWLFLDEILVN
jgi:predicted alpha-1,2-mannosidase